MVDPLRDLPGTMSLASLLCDAGLRRPLLLLLLLLSAGVDDLEVGSDDGPASGWLEATCCSVILFQPITVAMERGSR